MLTGLQPGAKVMLKIPDTSTTTLPGHSNPWQATDMKDFGVPHFWKLADIYIYTHIFMGP